jgi:hypothetical protein
VGYILLDQITDERYNGQTYRQLSHLVFFIHPLPVKPTADVMIEGTLQAIASRLKWTCGFLADYKKLYAFGTGYSYLDFFKLPPWSRETRSSSKLYHQPFPLEQHHRATHAGPSTS